MRIIKITQDRGEEYINQYGEHFNDKLADFAILHLKNVDGTSHVWTMSDIAAEFKAAGVQMPEKKYQNDLRYVANWLYSDWYPTAMPAPAAILKAAKRYLDDPDGEERSEYSLGKNGIKEI